MRHCFIVLLTLLSIISYGQNIGSKNNIVTVLGRFRVDTLPASTNGTDSILVVDGVSKTFKKIAQTDISGSSPQGLQDVIDVDNVLTKNDTIQQSTHTLTFLNGPSIFNTTATTPVTVMSGANGISVSSTLVGGANTSISTNGRIKGGSIFAYDQTYGVYGATGVDNFYATPGAVTAGVWGAGYQHNNANSFMGSKILAGVYGEIQSADSQAIGNREIISAVYGVSNYMGVNDTTYGVTGTSALSGNGGNHTFYSLYSKRFAVTNMAEMGGLLLDSIADNGGVHPYGINQKGNNNVNILNATTNYLPNLPTYSTGGNKTVVWNSTTHRLELTTGSGGTGISASDTAAMLSPYLRVNVAAATYQPQLNGTGFVKATGTTISYDNSSYQPLDADLTTIAGLTATTDNFIVSVSSAWASRTPAQVKTTLSLNNVENTALSTWAGSSNVTTVGTIGTGTWQGTAINNTYLASGIDAAKLTTGTLPNARIVALPNANLANSAITINGTSTSLGGSIDTRPGSASVSGSDVTTTSATASDVTGLSIAVAANKRYKITASLWIGCNNTGGVKFGINGPASSALLSGIWTGSNTTAPSVKQLRAAAIGSLSTASFNLVNANGQVTLVAYITTGATTGNVTIQFASANAGETSTVYIGSTFDLVEVQ